MNPLRRNTIANFVGRLVTALLWVVVTPYVLARLGVERFGIWALFFAFNGYLLALDLGVSSTMIRFMAAENASGNREGLTRTLRRGIRMGLGLGLFWAVLIGLARGWVASAFHVPAAMVPEALEALLIFAIGVLLMFPTQVLMGSLQGFERLDLSNLCMGLGVTAQVLVLYLGVAAGGGLKAAAAAGVVGQAIAGIFAAVLLRKQMREVHEGEPKPGSTWRDLLHFGAALQLTGFLIVFQIQLGKIMLGLLGNLAQVADYELAFRVASGVATLPILVLGAVVPTVSRAWESDGPAAVASIFTSTLRWVYVLSVVFLGLLWLVAPDITYVWLGPKNDRIAPLIRLWAMGCAVNFAWSTGAVVARGIGKPWIEFWSLLASVLMNIGLGIWCVPRYGTAGAIAALGVSYGAGFVAFVVTSRRAGISFGPWISRELVPRVVAAWVTVALCAWLVAARPVAGHLPPAGLTHGVLVALVFLILFAVLFAPLGDTQRLSRTVWQITVSPVAGGRGSSVQ